MKKNAVNSQVEIIHKLIKSKRDVKEKAELFNKELPKLTDMVLNGISSDEYNSCSTALRELFDSFAIVDVFSSMDIIDCYNEIKISLMKWERFADKIDSTSIEFKHLLDHFYEVMKDLYFYEIFGFFSTTVHPEYIPDANLPCKVFCGCNDGWQIEPYLDEDGKAKYANVIRFQDPENKEVPLCITIDGSEPRLLEPREKCSLKDVQIDIIKNFVRVNKGIILLHSEGIIDSPTFHSALRVKANPLINTPKYRIAYWYYQYLPDSNIRFPSKKILY